MNTCDKCSHWTRDHFATCGSPHLEEKYKDNGECDLFGDSNDYNEGMPRNDVCYGWDGESYSAGVIVMAKFGCIHWEEK